MILFFSLFAFALSNCDIVLEWQGVLGDLYNPSMNMHQVQRNALNKKLHTLAKQCSLWIYTSIHLPHHYKNYPFDEDVIPRDHIITTKKLPPSFHKLEDWASYTFDDMHRVVFVGFNLKSLDEMMKILPDANVFRVNDAVTRTTLEWPHLDTLYDIVQERYPTSFHAIIKRTFIVTFGILLAITLAYAWNYYSLTQKFFGSCIDLCEDAEAAELSDLDFYSFSEDSQQIRVADHSLNLQVKTEALNEKVQGNHATIL